MADQDRTLGKIVHLMGRKCPICGKPADIGLRPFCSKRCADKDLGKWLGDGYRIETNEARDPDQDPDAADTSEDDQ